MLKNKLKAADKTGRSAEIIEILEMENLLEKEVKDLSGGELQRFTIAMTIIQDAGVYLFDEPTSFLDIRKRIKVAQAIRSVVSSSNYVF